MTHDSPVKTAAIVRARSEDHAPYTAVVGIRIDPGVPPRLLTPRSIAEDLVPPRVRPTFYRGVGCPACSQTGYRGRTGIFELLVLDDEIRRLIGNKADSTSIRQAAMAKGMVTLKDEGAEKVFHGVTTTEELMRITQQEVEI